MKLRSTIDNAEKNASRRKNAGFIFNKRSGATSGQHPVMTLFLSPKNKKQKWPHARAASWLKQTQPLSSSPVRWRLRSQRWSQFLRGDSFKDSQSRKFCYWKIWISYWFIVQVDGAAVRQQFWTVTGKGHECCSCSTSFQKRWSNWKGFRSFCGFSRIIAYRFDRPAPPSLQCNCIYILYYISSYKPELLRTTPK